MMRRNQYQSREATLMGWSMFSLENITASNSGALFNWLEKNIEGRWAVAGFAGSGVCINLRFENVEDGVYARMVW